MSVSQTIETEEDLLPYLRIQIYHPHQHTKALYKLLPLGTRSKHSAEEPLRLGRNGQHCKYLLDDLCVSQKQLSFQAYRVPQSADMMFSIQNLSLRARLSVNGTSLDYLERTDLPDKALVRFGKYEILVVRESGEARGSFEVEFEVLTAPPSRETCLSAPCGPAILDSASLASSCGLRSFQVTQEALESDETGLCYS